MQTGAQAHVRVHASTHACTLTHTHKHLCTPTQAHMQTHLRARAEHKHAGPLPPPTHTHHPLTHNQLCLPLSGLHCLSGGKAVHHTTHPHQLQSCAGGAAQRLVPGQRGAGVGEAHLRPAECRSTPPPGSAGPPQWSGRGTAALPAVAPPCMPGSRMWVRVWLRGVGVGVGGRWGGGRRGQERGSVCQRVKALCKCRVHENACKNAFMSRYSTGCCFWGS